MNQETNIAALIEKNRIALLRMVFCWLSAAMCLNVAADKPLPRRLSAWVLDLIVTAEKAAGFLIIGIFYHGQIHKRFNPALEKAAHNLLKSNGTITLRALTIGGILKRLKALQHILHNLQNIARRLAKSCAAHALVTAIKIAALAAAQEQRSAQIAIAPLDAIPP